MEPGSPEMKRFRDLPHRSLNEALKAETHLAVKLSEVAADFIQKLATAEKAHSNKLSQVIKEFRDKTKGKLWRDSLLAASTQFAAWEALLTETEQEAKCCLWYSDMLDLSIKQPLLELTAKKEPLRKKWFEIRDACMTRVDKAEKHVEKLFQDYQNRWRDYAKCVDKAGGADHVEQSVVLHSYNAHNEYVMQLSAFNALHEEFYSKQIYDMLDELQTLQEQVVEGFQTCMQKHAQLNRNKLDLSLHNHKDSPFPEKLKNIDPSADISSLVSGQNVRFEIYPPIKCGFKTPELKVPAHDLPSLSDELQLIDMTKAPLMHAQKSLKQENLDLRNGLAKMQNEYSALHRTSGNPSLADPMTLLNMRNEIREKEAEVVMVTAKLTLSIHQSTEGAKSLSLTDDSDQVSVRTDREDSISMCSNSEDSFRLQCSEVFSITKGKDHDFIQIKGPAVCSYCKKLIQAPFSRGEKCRLCHKTVHIKCSGLISHCSGEPPVKNPKLASRFTSSSSSLSSSPPRPREGSTTSSSPASSLTSLTPASLGIESATALPNPFIPPTSDEIMSTTEYEECARLKDELQEVKQRTASKVGCEDCAKLKEELQEMKQRLYDQLTAELRKHQGDFGDSRSADEIGREFYSFFIVGVQEALKDVQQNRIEVCEQLCSIFQAIYSEVSKYVVEHLTEKLNDMFKVGAVDEATANDMMRAYARLLSAANLTGRHPDGEILTKIQRKLQNEFIQLPSIPSANMQQFITRAIDIAWSLARAVPPLISSCDEHTFRGDLHEKSFDWDDECPTNYKLTYVRPVLYANSLGAITQKGRVRNAKLDGGAGSTPHRSHSPPTIDNSPQVLAISSDTLAEKDLLDITDYLLDMDQTHLHNLGLVLGLTRTTLDAMMDSTTFLEDIIAAWLREEDGVKEKGEPTWTVLVNALKHPRVGQTGIANDIEKDKRYKF